MPLNVALKLPVNHFTWMLPFREILCAVVLTLCTECSTTDCHRLAALFPQAAREGPCFSPGELSRYRETVAKRCSARAGGNEGIGCARASKGGSPA